MVALSYTMQPTLGCLRLLGGFAAADWGKKINAFLIALFVEENSARSQCEASQDRELSLVDGTAAPSLRAAASLSANDP